MAYQVFEIDSLINISLPKVTSDRHGIIIITRPRHYHNHGDIFQREIMFYEPS